MMTRGMRVTTNNCKARMLYESELREQETTIPWASTVTFGCILQLFLRTSYV